MTFAAVRIVCAVLVGLAASLPSRADSFASSASSGASASVGSLSDSVHTSSRSSTRKVAEGEYRILEVADAGRPEVLRLKMAHAAEAHAIDLDVPRAALGDRAAAPGDRILVRQRPYGYEFAWADTRAAFFLALAADWERELEPRPVGS